MLPPNKRLRLYTFEKPTRFGPCVLLAIEDTITLEREVATNIEFQAITPGMPVPEEAILEVEEDFFKELIKYMERWKLIPAEQDKAKIEKLEQEVKQLKQINKVLEGCVELLNKAITPT